MERLAQAYELAGKRMPRQTPGLFTKERDRGGIAVQVTGVADRPDLTVTEKARARQRTENLRERRRVVTRHAEESLTSPIAGKKE